MTLEQLRIFVGVAEREHVTRAAEALNVTQSVASAAIAALEARHRVPLFNRVGRGIELTEAGRVFLDEARAVLGRTATAELVLSEFSGLKRGTLRVVASQTIASYWLPARLAEFHRRHPLIALELAIDNTEGAAERVLDGRAELGFVEGQIDSPALAAQGVLSARALGRAQHGVWARTAGLVIVRQRPGSAKGFCFLTFEDERDRISPMVVLHDGVRVAGIADTGPLQPFLANLDAAGAAAIAGPARAHLEDDRRFAARAAD